MDALFPTYIYSKEVDISDKYNEKLLKLVQDQNYYPNKLTYKSNASIEQKILDISSFKTLKSKIIICAKDYLKKLGHQFEDLQIINSWSTMTEKDGYSSLHSHKNSYISGCYYFTNTSALQLKNPNWNQWFLEPLTEFDEKNPATYGFVNFQPKQKVIILFPSHLEHRIMPNEKNKTRFSLAFNIIPKGEFGDLTQKLYL